MTKENHIPQLEVLASLQGQLVLGLADSALQSEHNLLGRLGLLVEDGLGLTTVTALLAVVTTLTLREQRGLDIGEKNGISKRSTWRKPERERFTFPALYWVTLCWVCFRHCLDLQYVRRVFGTLTWLS